MKIGDIINEFLEMSKEDIKKEPSIGNVEKMKASDLIEEAYNIVRIVEKDDDQAFFKNENRLTKEYGKMGCLYIGEFTTQLIKFINKFKKLSKRSVCITSIINNSVIEIEVKNSQD